MSNGQGHPGCQPHGNINCTECLRTEIEVTLRERAEKAEEELRTLKSKAGASYSIEQAAKRWNDATRYVALKRQELIAANAGLSQAEQILGKLLAPSDLRGDEKLGIWVSLGRKQEALILVSLTPSAKEPFRVEIRETK